MKTICVFCGSKHGDLPKYTAVARELGRILAQNDVGLVYGGGSVGLMTEIADAVLEDDGHVVGVIPQALVDMEVAHLGLPDLRIVHSMHERKALMAELSDGFIAMPGGFGTLEELFEVITWGQLGFHHKPCGVLNVEGYYDGLLSFLDGAVEHGFLNPVHRQMLLVSNEPNDLLEQLRAYEPPSIEKVLKEDEL
ncbi:MAG: TIGR00730 family Rossman fold protein [Deltaproteobacteria bacterium]|nr:MAG: TIGR00730 family Rossman fold protein [Deltaproteobacteria bacterium]